MIVEDFIILTEFLILLVKKDYSNCCTIVFLLKTLLRACEDLIFS